jgi:hypothetical protein
MTDLGPFFERLFASGEALLTGRPEVGDRREFESVLRAAFTDYRLAVAGPMIEFDLEPGIAAAMYTALACWFAVSRDEPAAQVKSSLAPLTIAATPAAHLTIDLTLRYAVTVHRRSRSQNPDDVLAKLLADTLRRWPLTGVLADIADVPTGDLTFASHRGLELLYAERLTANYRPAWLPADGRLRETIEWNYRQQGKTWPPREQFE